VISALIEQTLRHYGLRWPSPLWQLVANYRAVRRIEQLVATRIEQGRSVTVETVLSTLKYLPHLRNAKARGYRTGMVYVALATVDLNIARVRTRVEAGGHDVPEAKIRERWQRSHDNLVSLLPLLDELLVFDNSDIPPLLVAQKAGGTLTVLRTDRLPHLLVRLRPPA
jgi:predicted ABC-type ATPase